VTERRRTVVRLDGDALPLVVEVLSEAFHDYPVMRFVLGSDSLDYRRRLGVLVGFFVETRVLRGEVLLGIGSGGRLDGAAIVSDPARPSPPEVDELRERVWGRLGPAERRRYEAFGAACAPFQVEVPHIHLNMIGVRPAARGTGLSRALVDEVHRLSREDSASKGVTLTTESPGNVSLYRHFGYETVGHAVVAPELETWGFFRPDAGTDQEGF